MRILELPYEKINVIKSSIVQLEDLIAIFSQKDGPRLLHVYNTTEPPGNSVEDLEIITLEELPDKDLSGFDGPLVGFSALDVVRDDLLTKGPSFYPLQQIFVEQERRAALHQTMQHLASYLVAHLPEWAEKRSSFVQQRTKAKLIQLALPAIMEKLSHVNNLVAIIPSLDLEHFVYSGESQFIWNDPYISLNLNTFCNMDVDSDHDWIVALEELSLFNAGINLEGAGFIELRDILRLAGMEAALPTIRYQLARYCHDLSSGEEHQRHAAIALMVEYWLADEDVEDLVAFCPHKDFEHFAKTGDALRVYRLPIENNNFFSARPGIFCSLDQLLQMGVPPDYDQLIFTYPAALKYLCLPDSLKFLDLGEVLQKAGHQKVLARTYWLLSTDLFERIMSSEIRSSDTFDSVIDMAVRACLLFDLINPWEWRQGRWEQFLKSSYQDLLNILEGAAKRSDLSVAAYYYGLQFWYRCWLSTDPVGDLTLMLTILREFIRSLRDHFRPDLADHLMRAEHLDEIGKWILHQTQGDLRLESKLDQAAQNGALASANTPRVFRRTARLSKAWPLLSPLFLRGLEALLRARRRREELHSHVQDADTLILELRRLSSNLRRRQRVLFAPTHEQAILTLLYQQEIDHEELLLHEVETSTKLTANIRNPWLDIHQDIQLTLEIANVGKVEANNLEIVPMSLKGIQVLDESTLREIPALSAGSSTQVQYRVHVERLDSELQLECNFRDRSGQKRSDTWTFQLNVRSLDQSPFRVKVNHYQFGRPIQSPSDFYGRRAEFQNILSHLIGRNKQNLLLRGPRRMGKTSLLYMLSDVLKHPTTRRLFGIPLDWDSGLNQLHPVFLSLHAFSSQVGELQVSQFFQALLEGVANVLAIEPGESMNLVDTFRNRENEIGTVNAALEQVARMLGSRPGEQIVVLLDEYDEVYRPGSGGLDRGLREFVSVEQRLTWIIASTLGLFEAVKSVSSPWFNIFPIIELKRLSEQAAVNLVEKPSHEEGVVWRSDAVLALLEETGRHPAFTQLFCAKVIEHLNRVQSNYVLHDTIATVADQIVSEQETGYGHFEFFWSDTPGTGQLILLILDDQDIPLRRDEIRQRVLALLTQEFGNLPRRRVKDPYGDLLEWWDKEFKRGIDWADEIADAISPDAQRRYVFSMPILRRWLRRRRQHEDLRAEALDKISKEMERDGLDNT
jgi:hypothetical protein